MSQNTASTANAASPVSMTGRATLLDQKALIGLGVVSIAFVGLFYRWFWMQGQMGAAAPSDWGHVFVIPLISGFVIWKNREAIARTRVVAFWPALAPLLLAVMGYFLCIVGIRNHMLQGLCMILAVFSSSLLLLGPAVMRYLFLPIAFLVFGITIAEIIMIKITFPLQLTASKGAYGLLSICGAIADFEVSVDGNRLDLLKGSKSFPLNVAEACSGMRMVIAFLALAACVALLQTKIWWQRVALLLLGPVVAVLMNVIRVAILGLLTLVDPKLIQGESHILIGTLLLIPALGLFMGCQWVLDRIFVEAPENDGKAQAA